MEIDDVSIGERVRKLRHLCGYTQEELAERCGISLSFLGHIERGTRKMSLETLSALAQNLGVTADALLFGSRPSGQGALLGELAFRDDVQRERFQAAVQALALGLEAF